MMSDDLLIVMPCHDIHKAIYLLPVANVSSVQGHT